MIILFILLAVGGVPFGVAALLLWRWRPDAGPALLIGAVVGVMTAFGVFVVALGIIDGMHTWDLSMGDYWLAALAGLLAAAVVALIVGLIVYRRVRVR
ncbi:MAG: hypothetical protein ABI635_08920 [Actinomycetota bacterium]